MARMVEPKVILLAKTSMVPGALSEFLEEIGAPEWQTDAPSDGETLIEVAGRLCYKSFRVGLNPNVTKIREGNRPYLANILKSGHGSVLEHTSMSFMFLNVSRVFTHELVRHRAGTAYSQESQRYVSFTEIPLTRTSDMSLEDELVLLQSANSIEKEYNSLTMRMLGKPFAIVKQLTSKFRRMIGQGVATNILMTANLRALQHIIALRTSEHAEVEIRDVFLEVERICRQEYPNIFQR